MDHVISEIKVIRSSRKTMVLEIIKDGTILVRAPYRMPESEIRRFIQEKSDWIEKHVQRIEERQRTLPPVEGLTMKDIRKLADQASVVIPKRVEYFAEKIPVTYGRITIRNQKTRWGSCSSKGNLNFNCLLMLAPPEVLDYVVVHELCHRKEMNHSERFWREVENILPDYRERKKWLKENGGRLIARMQVHETI
ncbi:MAG: SprT family zinc-dependent metalloprotease [Firmicutes bacterium]|nr:M48 family metallopeptidase [Lachnospiraceae bacterium]MDD6065759.1 SprT family zinc-dependent metalloprotease [Bacillota bacterium]